MEAVLKNITLIVIYFLSTVAHAETLYIEIFEAKENNNYTYYLDLDSLEIVEERDVGDAIKNSSTGSYYISDGKVSFKGRELIDADELLFESNVNGKDVLLVRDEYNSFSNPLKLLSAFVGHPVQTSQIYILVIESGKLKNKLRLQKQDSSYEWQVKVHYAN
jgi:hypothetical protein